MRFNAFPMDIQVKKSHPIPIIYPFTWVLFQICKFKVGSFNYPMNKITFDSEVNWQLINLENLLI